MWLPAVRLLNIHFVAWEQHTCRELQQYVQSRQISSSCMGSVSSRVELHLYRNFTREETDYLEYWGSISNLKKINHYLIAAISKTIPNRLTLQGQVVTIPMNRNIFLSFISVYYLQTAKQEFNWSLLYTAVFVVAFQITMHCNNEVLLLQVQQGSMSAYQPCPDSGKWLSYLQSLLSEQKANMQLYYSHMPMTQASLTVQPKKLPSNFDWNC